MVAPALTFSAQRPNRTQRLTGLRGADDIRYTALPPRDGEVDVFARRDHGLKSLPESARPLLAHFGAAGHMMTRFRNWLGNRNLSDRTGSLSPVWASGLVPGLYFKAEYNTITESYKIRGAFYALSRAMEAGRREFVTVSTGNHALSLIEAARLRQPKALTIVVPENTAPHKLVKIEAALGELRKLIGNATLLRRGRTFDEAREWVSGQANLGHYIAPYDQPDTVTGQGTVGLELARQLGPVLKKRMAQQPGQPQELVLIAPVGGGGLLSSTALALKSALQADKKLAAVDLRVVGVRLANPESPLGDAIRVKHVAPDNQALPDALDTEMRQVADHEIESALAWMKQETPDPLEGAAAAAVHPVLAHSQYKPNANRLVVSILSGGNVH